MWDGFCLRKYVSTNPIPSPAVGLIGHCHAYLFCKVFFKNFKHVRQHYSLQVKCWLWLYVGPTKTGQTAGTLSWESVMRPRALSQRCHSFGLLSLWWDTDSAAIAARSHSAGQECCYGTVKFRSRRYFSSGHASRGSMTRDKQRCFSEAAVAER